MCCTLKVLNLSSTILGCWRISELFSFLGLLKNNRWQRVREWSAWFNLLPYFCYLFQRGDSGGKYRRFLTFVWRVPDFVGMGEKVLTNVNWLPNPMPSPLLPWRSHAKTAFTTSYGNRDSKGLLWVRELLFPYQGLGHHGAERFICVYASEIADTNHVDPGCKISSRKCFWTWQPTLQPNPLPSQTWTSLFPTPVTTLFHLHPSSIPPSLPTCLG